MLVGKRVCLNQFRSDDRERMFEWINDAELVRLNASYRPVHSVAHHDWFDSIAHDASRVIFAVRLWPKRQLIGVVQLLSIHHVHRSAEMRIRIGSNKHLGKGFGTEALSLLLDFAWQDLNLHRVITYVFASNGRAIASYKKAGFLEEGRLREAAYINGSWTDIIVMGVLNPTS